MPALERPGGGANSDASGPPALVHGGRVLFPKPPQPVGRRRAVAEMIVAYRQAETIAVGHVFHVPPAAPTAAPPQRAEDDRPPVSQSGHDTPV